VSAMASEFDSRCGHTLKVQVARCNLYYDISSTSSVTSLPVLRVCGQPPFVLPDHHCGCSLPRRSAKRMVLAQVRPARKRATGHQVAISSLSSVR
jgi:hypothetical protein